MEKDVFLKADGRCCWWSWKVDYFAGRWILQVETEGGTFCRQVVDAAGGDGRLIILQADGRCCKWRLKVEHFSGRW